MSWKTIRSEIAPDGAFVELRYAEFGKGRSRLRSWAIYRDGFKAGYAAVDRDVDVNYRRVLEGYERNAQTSHYEPAPRRVPDACPMCHADLKSDGYPSGHQIDGTGEACPWQLPEATCDFHPSEPKLDCVECADHAEFCDEQARLGEHARDEYFRRFPHEDG